MSKPLTQLVTEALAFDPLTDHELGLLEHFHDNLAVGKKLYVNTKLVDLALAATRLQPILSALVACVDALGMVDAVGMPEPYDKTVRDALAQLRSVCGEIGGGCE